ncbi:hypothetical protein DXG01_004146 [Tephrocybe rancida]|nr:hypothetical protein DXG01_004146 [Tephrocybe rancida]
MAQFAASESPMSTQLHQSLTDRIPNELYDHLISQFHADKPALATCTLVCSSWLPRARHHLLTTARITRLLRAQRFLELTYAPQGILGTLVPVIRSLEIYSSSRVDPGLYAGRLPGLERMYVSGVARYFGPGECLQTLEWKAWFCPRAAQLTDLALGHVTLGAFVDFVGVLPEFGALKHLALIGVTWLDPFLPTPPTNVDMEFPNIRSVILSGRSIHLIPYLLARGVTETARVDLRVGKHKSDEALPRQVEAIEYYMHLLGPNIQELDLHDDSYESAFGTHSDLALPKLRTLWLHGIDLAASNPWAAQILERLAAPTLNTLTLDVYLDSLLALQPSPNVHPGWDAIQHAATGNPNLAQIRRVKVRWLPGDHGKVIGNELPLPALREVECEVEGGALPCASTLEPYRVYERWFDRRGAL